MFKVKIELDVLVGKGGLLLADFRFSCFVADPNP